MKALLVLLILGTLFSSVAPRKNFARNVDSAESSDVNWYKELNNILSVASQNLIVSGEFLALYPFSNLDRLPSKGTCDRRITVDLDKPEKFDGILEKIYDTGIIKIGVTSLLSLPYYSNATGTPTGFFYDLGNSVANEIGFLLKKTIRARFVTFATTNFQNDALAALSSGLVDTVIGTSYTVARSTLFDYSCWYETPSPFAVWVNPSHNLPIATPTTLSGFNNPAIKVATLGGSIFETAVIKYLPLAQRVSFPTMNAAYASVGVTTDISFSIVGETEAFAQANNNVIVIVPGTRVEFGGGNAFSTRRV